MENLTELLTSYNLEHAHPSYLFSLQDDLSLREGCTGPPLSDWESLSPAERLSILEQRWLHIISAMSDTAPSSKDNELWALANNAWTCFENNKERPEFIKALWKALLAIPPDKWQKSRWRCCSTPSDAATRVRPRPTKTATQRDRTPTPSPSIDEEEGGTDEVGQPCDDPQPNTPTTRGVRDPIPAPDEDSSLTSASRSPCDPINIQRTRLDRPSPPPSANREREEEVSVTHAGSDTEMREPTAPGPPIICPCCRKEFLSWRKLGGHGPTCPAIPSSARAKTNGITPNQCIFCARKFRSASLSNHERLDHYTFPCGAIATAKGHSKCSKCKPLQQKGATKAFLNPLDYLMSERQDDEPPERQDDEPPEAEAADAPRLHAAVDKLARSICPEERDLLLRCRKDILATILHEALARTEAMTDSSQHTVMGT
jgi:hypothetical protein